ncbi:MAG: fasciclin domain-containing protein [Chroococcidiopsidaceae cyanobacterium CP_BM_RX_35]|nr:fasciclin domain-containing protein [Chroococcidiopsidaceae cyanobacterium CP_BM_RX_35]
MPEAAPAASLSKLRKLAVNLLGVVAASILIGFPARAQNSGGGSLNPHPSIFNEAPYKGRENTPSNNTTTTPSSNQPTTRTQNNIVAVTAANGSFKTLTMALAAAGLDKTLTGKGPFTIFAPTDQAFATLPPATLQQLLRPENKDLLVKILTYHVVPGKITSTQLKTGEVQTVEGSPLQIKASQGGVMVNNADVTNADIVASNGVIHAINQVMLPPDLQGSSSSNTH